MSTYLPARNLDLLRTLAVLCVFGDHLITRTFYLPGLSVIGRVGVLLFFVHTSYVLMHSLERLSLKTTSKKFIPTFYIRRALRMYPLSMITVIIITCAGSLYAIPASRILGVFLSNFFLVQNIAGHPNITAVLWTLPIEMQMYVLLPFCFIIAKRNIRSALYILGFSMVLGVWTLSRGGQHFDLIYFAPCFLAGVLAYALSRHVQIPKLLGKYWVLSLFTTVFLSGLLFRPNEIRSVIYGWAVCLCVAVLLPLFQDMKRGWITAFSHHIATYSYGIYLLHTPAILLASGSWVGAIILTGIFAVLAYHFIEAPGIRLGIWLTKDVPTTTDSSLAITSPP